MKKHIIKNLSQRTMQLSQALNLSISQKERLSQQLLEAQSQITELNVKVEGLTEKLQINKDNGFIEDSYEGDGVGVWDDQMFEKPAGLSKPIKILEHSGSAAASVATAPANNGGN